ncbi:hypothetical protein COLO4_06921 [Corchorus olitorius]|uniref:Uncharacterized protein n=1 Tax=Corchorus olitorius TaxID=93759 RepID=A0A1R3KLJ6_9ROSI|nr:hypothetical protein COLO4_06921 [Corchorus olitorius]
MWLKHRDAPEYIVNCWNRTDGDLIDKSNLLVDKLKSWNKDVFGNVFECKKKLRARVLGVQRALARRRNKISMLKNDDGEWVLTQEQLKLMVIEYYTQLFSVESLCRTQLNIDCPKLLTDHLEDLDIGISMAEVKKALFQMKPWKALVNNAFENGVLPMELCETLIVLIPKVHNPENLKQFRPIRLCCARSSLRF